MVKQIVVHNYHGVLLCNKKEQTIDTYNLFSLHGIILSEVGQFQEII